MFEGEKFHKKRDKNGEFFFERTPEYLKFVKRGLLDIRMKRATLPQKIADYNIKDYIGPDKKHNLIKVDLFINKFKEKFFNRSLYFYSRKNSTQKTTLASYIGRELMNKGFSVKFVLADTLIGNLKDASFKEEELSEELKIYKECDLLIIDDAFDNKKSNIYASGYQLSFLDSFLRTRLEVFSKSTIFTSNYPIEEIIKVFGVSIQALVKRNTTVLEFEDSIYLKDDFEVEDIFK